MNTLNLPPTPIQAPGSRPLSRRRLFLIALAAFAIALGLFYAVEYWRGKRAWEACKRRYEARGFVLDWTRLIPPSVPDDQNVLKAPRMTEWFVQGKDPSPAGDLARRLEGRGDSTYLSPTSAIDTDEQARQYLAWSERFTPDFALIRQALKRPQVRIDGDYRRPVDLPMPNFIALRLVAQTLAQRAHCHLMSNQPEEALSELTLVHQLRRIAQSPPPLHARTLVEAMIDAAIAGLYVERIAEGAARHAWRAEDLVELQRQLQGMDVTHNVIAALRNEPMAYSYQVEHSPASWWLGYYSPYAARFAWVWPRGWTYQNLAAYVDIFLSSSAWLAPADAAIAPASLKQAQEDFDRMAKHRSPYRLFSAIAIPNFVKARSAAARIQSLVQQARIGCALERYWLAHGGYPETLEALAPQFLPKVADDTVNGRPFRYNRLPGGTYRLYSIGLDGKDDGGQDSLNDWVWPGSPR